MDVRFATIAPDEDAGAGDGKSCRHVSASSDFWNSTMAAVSARNIFKRFDDVLAVNGMTLTVPDGEFMVLLGPSGCGKTTFLRIVCGLERQTSGDLVIGGNNVNDIPPRARGVAMMFQSYGLYPHYTVRKNMAFPLRTHRVPSADINRKVKWESA